MKYKMTQLKEMKLPELKELLAEQESKLRSLRFQVSQNEIKQVDQIGKVRKLVAQIKTVMGQQE
jgi:ribosomal protein L29